MEEVEEMESQSSSKTIDCSQPSAHFYFWSFLLSSTFIAVFNQAKTRNRQTQSRSLVDVLKYRILLKQHQVNHLHS